MNQDTVSDFRPSTYITIVDQPTATGSSYFSANHLTSRGTGINMMWGGSEDEDWTSDSNSVIQIGDSTVPVYKKRYKNRKEKKKRGSKDGANDPNKRLSILKPTIVYQFVKDRFKPIEKRILEKRFQRICAILQGAKATGQIALIDKIRDKYDVFIREQELVSCGFDRYIEQKVLETFAKSAKDRIIKISPLKNYVRVIPKRAQRTLEKAQDRKLFDGFVVVHTDPNDTAVEKTAAEKRDPILFGLMHKSTRYYFVADWVDELCDLTMNQIIDALDMDPEDYTIPDNVEMAMAQMLLPEGQEELAVED